MRCLAITTLWLTSLAVTACGDDSSSPGPETAPTTFAEQVTLGASLYASSCSSCHGSSGQGSGNAPRLVGLDEGALPEQPRAGSKRTNAFLTVADVAAFVVENMPPSAPGTLSDEEYWAILAFALSENGIELQQMLDADLASEIMIPR